MSHEVIFNDYRDVQVLKNRQLLDRRRLEDAHLKFAWYPDSIEHPQIFTPSLNETLQRLTPLYHDAFLGIYSSKVYFN